MKDIKNLLKNNKSWAEKVKKEDPDFFTNLSKIQTPTYLWIGCADSRVPANQITGELPGNIFVHRNIANMVVHTDLNCLSVIQYAVEHLKIKHIIICGHYDCGGVKASLTNNNHGLVDNWLRNIKDVQRLHQNELNNIKDESKKIDRLCELNVIEQVENLGNTTIIQNAWKNNQILNIHGWIYSVGEGVLKDLKVSKNKI